MNKQYLKNNKNHTALGTDLTRKLEGSQLSGAQPPKCFENLCSRVFYDAENNKYINGGGEGEREREVKG